MTETKTPTKSIVQPPNVLTLQDRHHDILVLQRRANKVLNNVTQDVQAAQDDLAGALSREVKKFMTRDASPEFYRAIEAAAWDSTGDSKGGKTFADTAQKVAAHVRLQKIESEHGSTDVLLRSLGKQEKELRAKESALDKVSERTQTLDVRMEFIREANEGLRRYLLTLNNKDRIEAEGFLSRGNYQEAAKIVKAYGREFGRRTHNGFMPADCFRDMIEHEEVREEQNVLKQELSQLGDQYYKQAGMYQERRTLGSIMTDRSRSGLDLDKFQDEFVGKLKDERFLNSFARALPSGQAADIIEMAVKLNLRQSVLNYTKAFEATVDETTRLLEGPIGIFAKHAENDSTYDGIERDVRAQAIMAGYLSQCAADISNVLEDFEADHIDGPSSLRRDVMMQMGLKAKIDPAYLSHVCGIDKTLAGYFNVKARNPRPDFEGTLEAPSNVAMMDQTYAAFLSDNKNDEIVNRAGFSSGHIDRVSFETLLCRYFSTRTTIEEITEEIETQAQKMIDEQEAEESSKIDQNLRSLGRKARDAEAAESDNTKSGESPQGKPAPHPK